MSANELQGLRTRLNALNFPDDPDAVPDTETMGALGRISHATKKIQVAARDSNDATLIEQSDELREEILAKLYPKGVPDDVRERLAGD